MAIGYKVKVFKSLKERQAGIKEKKKKINLNKKRKPNIF